MTNLVHENGPMWWTAPHNSREAHQLVWNTAERLNNFNGMRIKKRCKDLLLLYEGKSSDFTGLSAYLFEVLGDDSSYNVVKSCSDTLQSHVMNVQVRPMFLTDQGEWQLQENVKAMQRGVEAIFTKEKLWGDLGEDICMDGILWGLGTLWVEADKRNMMPRYHRLFPWEVLYSSLDSQKGRPRSVMVRRIESRSILYDRFKDDKEAINAIRCANSPNDLDTDYLQDSINIYDPVVVVYAWHLPSGSVDRDDSDVWDPELAEHDGRYICAIDGAILCDELYPYEHFPFAHFRAKRAAIGYRGRGLTEALVGIQLEIIRMMRRISAIMQLHAVPLIYIWRAARVNTQKLLTNSYSRVLEGNQPAGQSIQYISPNSVPSEYLSQLQRLIEFAQFLSGISELSSASRKPKDIESGIALQTLLDNENIRHTPTFKSWENFFTEVGEITVDVLRTLAREGPIELVFHDDKELIRIPWEEFDVGENRSRLKTWPTNLLPKTPSARLQRALMMYEKQLFSAEQVAELLDFPDIEAATQETNASRKAVRAKIDYAISGDQEKAAPNAYTDLALLIATAKQRYQVLEAEGAPPNVLQRISDLIDQAAVLVKRAQPPAPPQAGPPMGPSAGPPMQGPPMGP